MGEGFGDYWCGSYSASISSYHEEWVFNWDGHNPFWNGRILNTTDRYPDDLNGSVHHDGQIWSAPLFQSWHEIGRDVMDQLILQSHFYLGTSATMPQGADAVMQADLDLNEGLHAGTLFFYFLRRGILRSGDYDIPAITHTPLEDTGDEGPYEVTCQVTSGEPLVAGSIKVVYGTDGVFDQEATLDPTGNPDEYSGYIASQGTDVTVTYYIKAQNTTGFQGTHPRGAEQTHHAFAVTGFSAADESQAIPSRLELGLRSNPTLTGGEVRLALPAEQALDLVIFDASGRRVRTLFSGVLTAGAHRLAWDGRDQRGVAVAPGIYFAKLSTEEGEQRVRKLVLAR
jgi:hypothetical protein